MSYTVYYHSACQAFTGRADGILLMLEEAGVTYECKTPDQFPSDVSFPCFAPPFVTTPAGLTMSQTPAIMWSLGKELKLYPSTLEDEAHAMQMVFDSADYLKEFLDNKMKEGGDRGAKWASGRLLKWLDLVDSCISRSAGDFAVGKSATYADYAILYSMNGLAYGLGDAFTNALAKRRRLSAWRAMMMARPKVQAMYGKGVPILMPALKAHAPLIEIGYWNIRGLGAVTRMVCEFAEASYDDRQYVSFEAWKERKAELLKVNPLANLPYVKAGDIVVCQSNAVLKYLGDMFGLNGSSDDARLRNSQLLDEVFDVRNSLLEIAYPFPKITRDQAEFEANAANKAENPPFGKFEDWLGREGTDFFCGAGPNTADFHIWEMLDQHKLLAEKIGRKVSVLDQFPKCKAFYERFRALPTLAKYFASDAYKLPINNKLGNAHFM